MSRGLGHREYRQDCKPCRARGFGCFYTGLDHLAHAPITATQETTTVPETIRFDENPKEGAGSVKAPLDYLEPLVNPLVAAAMKHGADKYGYRNYTVTPCKIRTYIAAARRHLDAIALGEDIDPDSGLPHWAHVIAGSSCYLACELTGIAVDDRQAISTSRSDAVHLDGNQDAKADDWQEPAGEPAPPSRPVGYDFELDN